MGHSGSGTLFCAFLGVLPRRGRRHPHVRREPTADAVRPHKVVGGLPRQGPRPGRRSCRRLLLRRRRQQDRHRAGPHRLFPGRRRTCARLRGGGARLCPRPRSAPRNPPFPDHTPRRVRRRLVLAPRRGRGRPAALTAPRAPRRAAGGLDRDRRTAHARLVALAQPLDALPRKRARGDDDDDAHDLPHALFLALRRVRVRALLARVHRALRARLALALARPGRARVAGPLAAAHALDVIHVLRAHDHAQPLRPRAGGHDDGDDARVRLAARAVGEHAAAPAAGAVPAPVLHVREDGRGRRGRVRVRRAARRGAAGVRGGARGAHDARARRGPGHEHPPRRRRAAVGGAVGGRVVLRGITGVLKRCSCVCLGLRLGRSSLLCLLTLLAFGPFGRVVYPYCRLLMLLFPELCLSCIYETIPLFIWRCGTLFTSSSSLT